MKRLKRMMEIVHQDIMENDISWIIPFTYTAGFFSSVVLAIVVTVLVIGLSCFATMKYGISPMSLSEIFLCFNKAFWCLLFGFVIILLAEYIIRVWKMSSKEKKEDKEVDYSDPRW